MIRVKCWQSNYEYEEGYPPAKVMRLKEFQEMYNVNSGGCKYGKIEFVVE